jgi:hypothetical protein
MSPEPAAHPARPQNLGDGLRSNRDGNEKNRPFADAVAEPGCGKVYFKSTRKCTASQLPATVISRHNYRTKGSRRADFCQMAQILSANCGAAETVVCRGDFCVRAAPAGAVGDLKSMGSEKKEKEP